MPAPNPSSPGVWFNQHVLFIASVRQFTLCHFCNKPKYAYFAQIEYLLQCLLCALLRHLVATSHVWNSHYYAHS